MTMNKREKRFLQKQRHVEKQVDIYNQHYGHVSPYDKEPHRLHKKKALNCGDPKCIMCMNPRKSFGEKTLQERKFECVPLDS